MHHDALRLDFHNASGLHKAPVQLFGLGLVKAVQPGSQPAVATVGDDGQRDVEIDIEAYLARQAVEVEEVDADPQGIFNTVPTGIACDQVAGAGRHVVRQEQRRVLPAEAGNGQLADEARIVPQTGRLVEIADVLVTAFGDINDGPLPGRGR